MGAVDPYRQGNITTYLYIPFTLCCIGQCIIASVIVCDIFYTFGTLFNKGTGSIQNVTLTLVVKKKIEVCIRSNLYKNIFK